MKKATLDKLRANLDKALDPPRPTAPPKADNSEVIAQRYAVVVEPAPLRDTESVPRPEFEPRTEIEPGTKSPAIPVQNVPRIESAPRPESVPHKGYFRLSNEFIYDLMPRLKPSDGYVLLYLLARTHGFRQTQVRVTLEAIATACSISRSQARVNINSLVKKGYVQHLGIDSSNRNPLLRGLILEVLKPMMRGTDSERGTEFVRGAESTPNKEKELKKDSKRESASPDFQNCPDCHGTGFHYVDELDRVKGVEKCKHGRLK